MEEKKSPITERRNESAKAPVWWSKLTLAQKFSASSLGKFGYELLFIRHVKGQDIAVLQCNGGIATITPDGEINTTAKIKLRSK
ncbi:hypothetical protein [Pseudocolwellia agarivorans]|uniref:hypothetical protein n=1 Tax=Pseudocolwellia agarivorans TaxID=1911682 RepID=UPI0015894EA1|nr:hypothetical protein [Pseudocolwellia agarivorans]